VYNLQRLTNIIHVIYFHRLAVSYQRD